MTRLTPVAADIWIADGPDVSFLGFPYSTRMVVIRLRGGGLFVYSPIPPDADLLQDIDRLGPVAFLVSPNKIHHLFLGDWKRIYPQALMFASPGLAARRADLTFDGALQEAPDPGWADDIDQVMVHGSFAMTEVAFFHRASRTLIIADLIQRFAPEHFTFWKRQIMRLWGLTAPMGGAPREFRLSFIFGKRKLRRAVAQMLAWQPERILIAHGLNVETDAVAYLKRAFNWA